jgi:hypothetical protein
MTTVPVRCPPVFAATSKLMLLWPTPLVPVAREIHDASLVADHQQVGDAET